MLEEIIAKLSELNGQFNKCCTSSTTTEDKIESFIRWERFRHLDDFIHTILVERPDMIEDIYHRVIYLKMEDLDKYYKIMSDITMSTIRGLQE